jgi:Tfp pilus assembly protein PilO
MTDAKLVRFSAVLIVLAGYAFVFRAGEARLDARIGENARIAEQLRDGERTLASRTALNAGRTRLRDRLRSAGTAMDRSTLVARFLRDAARIASEHHAAITTITASGPATVSTSGASVMVPGSAAGTGMQRTAGAAAERTPSFRADEPFEEIPLEMTVEGRYADVLATIRALPSGRILASVDVTSLARKSAASADGTLTASLRVVLERIVPATETADAPPRPV